MALQKAEDPQIARKRTFIYLKAPQGLFEGLDDSSTKPSITKPEKSRSDNLFDWYHINFYILFRIKNID